MDCCRPVPPYSRCSPIGHYTARLTDASHLPADTTLQTYISGFSRYTEATHCRTTSRPSAFTDLVSTITGPSYLNNKITACALPPRAHRAMRASNDRTTSPEHAAHGPPCSTDTSPRRLPMTQLGDLTPPLITAPNAQAVPPNDPDHVRLGNIVRLRRLLLDSIQRRLDLQLNISHLIRSQIHALTSPRTQLRREPLQQPAAHPSDPNFQAASPRQDASADDPTDTATTCHLPADNHSNTMVTASQPPDESRVSPHPNGPATGTPWTWTTPQLRIPHVPRHVLRTSPAAVVPPTADQRPRRHNSAPADAATTTPPPTFFGTRVNWP